MAPLRILLVDDFASWRSYVASVLQERACFEVVGEAADGQEAIEKATELQPDLILMDIAMPKLNGIEAARRIRDRAANSKIVFISLEISDELAEAAVAVGAQAYIAKREIRAKLLPTIDSLFGK
ncbi:MAG: response regulator transcription factor [Acidobacteriota bacterium]|jgi:DNA-binding NarL/FixJ family response regulator|nr:response regulator transcription factor [Terriglobales bacterium]